MRRVSVWIGLIISLVMLAGCGQSAKVPAFTGTAGKLKVATSFYPLYEFTRAVGGDQVDLVNLVPPGTEPHDWEPTAAHIKTLNQAAVFIYNGAGMEHWLDKTLKSLDNKALVTVETSRGVDLIKGDGQQEQWDPHVWLDPQSAIHQVEAIRDGLAQADPAHKDAYMANAAAYSEKIRKLDEEYRTVLSGCPKQEFFTSHAAFGYLARRYGLTQRAIMGLTPDAEPQPKELAAIVNQAKAQGVKYIFFETLVSDKVSKVVAEEVGAKTLVLNPFEGLTDADIKAGKDYLSVMRENLANLKLALECGK